MQGEIGIQDAGQSDVRKVESLGDHLGPQEDLDLLGTKVAQDIAHGIFLTGGVSIEARDPSLGEDLFEHFLHFLSPIALQ